MRAQSAIRDLHPTAAIAEIPCLLATARGRVEATTRPLSALREDEVRVRTEVTMAPRGHDALTEFPLPVDPRAEDREIGGRARIRQHPDVRPRTPPSLILNLLGVALVASVADEGDRIQFDGRV
jgi:hypothetical protein